jgi:hypothetical protein
VRRSAGLTLSRPRPRRGMPRTDAVDEPVLGADGAPMAAPASRPLKRYHKIPCARCRGKRAYGAKLSGLCDKCWRAAPKKTADKKKYHADYRRKVKTSRGEDADGDSGSDGEAARQRHVADYVQWSRTEASGLVGFVAEGDGEGYNEMDGECGRCGACVRPPPKGKGVCQCCGQTKKGKRGTRCPPCEGRRRTLAVLERLRAAEDAASTEASGDEDSDAGVESEAPVI